ncbi:MAG: DUF4349 domain-containing protein [Chloroflexi bacterium]|nr:DUF4349 domain-containing protein [Chloroflexota bacterium]
MKRTLITISLTTVVVLTLIGVVTGLFAPKIGNTFSDINYSLPAGGGGVPEMMYLPAEAPAQPSLQLMGGGGSDKSYEAEVFSPATERMVIQNVDMSIVVADPKARMDEIARMAEDMGGFVVSSNLYRSTYGPNEIEVPEASITIRVPAERLDEALEKIKADVVEVTYENRSGQDVTSQYVDLKSRLAAKEEAEKNLLKIMDTATNAEDVLAIYLQVQNIQTEIESLKGQIKYLEESAALSAISIRLVAEEKVKPIEIGGWKLQGTANDAVQDLIRFTQGFTRFLIRLFLTYLPALILIAIPAYGAFLGGRALLRRFRKAKPVVEAKEEKK